MPSSVKFSIAGVQAIRSNETCKSEVTIRKIDVIMWSSLLQCIVCLFPNGIYFLIVSNHISNIMQNHIVDRFIFHKEVVIGKMNNHAVNRIAY